MRSAVSRLTDFVITVDSFPFQNYQLPMLNRSFVLRIARPLRPEVNLSTAYFQVGYPISLNTMPA